MRCAQDVVRYAGEWVAAVVADTRALAEDAAELVEVEYEPTAARRRSRGGDQARQPARASGARLQRASAHRRFVWGAVDDAFARAEHTLASARDVGRSSTVPIETFGVAAQWDAGQEILDVWASIQMPKFPDQLARALRLPGQRGARALRRGRRRQLRRQARPQAHRAGGLSRAKRSACRCASSRTGSRTCAAATCRGPTAFSTWRPRSTATGRPRAEDPRARRRRRVRRTLAVPARQAGDRDLRPVPHRGDRVRADVGDDQQDAAGSGARLRPGADQFRDRAHASIAWRATSAWTAIELRRRNLHPQGRVPVPHPERLDLRLGRLPRGARQGARGDRLPGARQKQRDSARARGPARGHRHLDVPRALRRQLRLRAAVQSRRTTRRPGWIPASCAST